MKSLHAVSYGLATMCLLRFRALIRMLVSHAYESCSLHSEYSIADTALCSITLLKSVRPRYRTDQTMNTVAGSRSKTMKRIDDANTRACIQAILRVSVLSCHVQQPPDEERLHHYN